MEAVANRVIPGDDWPSASENGVLDYLERYANEDAAVWSGLLEPGLRALEQEAAARHGRPFAALPAEAQDGLLRDVEQARVRDWPVAAKRFFETFVALVAEGYYGSPEAGGNPEGKSWAMIGFRPGPVSGSETPVRDRKSVV